MVNKHRELDRMMRVDALKAAKKFLAQGNYTSAKDAGRLARLLAERMKGTYEHTEKAEELISKIT